MLNQIDIREKGINLSKVKKCYVVVSTQQELDALQYNDSRVIVIAFGTPEEPARVTTPFNTMIMISSDFHATIYSGNRVYANENSHVQVSRDSLVMLKGYAGCEVYGASYIIGMEDSRIYLQSDAARVERMDRNKMYRRRLPEF